MGLFNFFSRKPKESPVSFEGGPGDCMENAVIIHAPDSILGIMAEYMFVESRCGVKDKDWTLSMQFNLTENSRDYDWLVIEMNDGTRKDFYFDITEFYGKF